MSGLPDVFTVSFTPTNNDNGPADFDYTVRDATDAGRFSTTIFGRRMSAPTATASMSLLYPTNVLTSRTIRR